MMPASPGSPNVETGYNIHQTKDSSRQLELQDLSESRRKLGEWLMESSGRELKAIDQRRYLKTR
jgi:hypothetical protein